MAKTDQDQHLKLSPQTHIIFLKVFLSRNIVSPPQAKIHGRNSLSFPRHLFSFWSSSFQNLGLKVVPQLNGVGVGADTMDSSMHYLHHLSLSDRSKHCFYWIILKTSRTRKGKQVKWSLFVMVESCSDSAKSLQYSY